MSITPLLPLLRYGNCNMSALSVSADESWASLSAGYLSSHFTIWNVNGISKSKVKKKKGKQTRLLAAKMGFNPGTKALVLLMGKPLGPCGIRRDFWCQSKRIKRTGDGMSVEGCTSGQPLLRAH